MSAETYTETYATPSKPVRVVDVSSVQGVPRYNEVAAAGIMGAVIKCTEGLEGIDRLYVANYRGFTDAGIACGTYHFCRPSTKPGVTPEQDAVTEMRRFYELSDGLGSRPGEIPPVLDFEDLCGQSPAVAAAWIRVALLEAERLWQRRPLLYTGLTVANALLMFKEATQYDLWLAFYPQQPGKPAMTWEAAEAFGSPLASRIMAPLPWKGDAWRLWQFSGGGPSLPGNRVPGIDAEVDCNRFNGNEDDWASFLAAA